MAYDATKPLDNGYLADAPAELRELFRALKEDKIVNAGQLNGYTQGNASGNIPLNNGTVNTNLNADLLDGHDSAYFSAATHGHGDATTNASGFMSASDKTKLNGIATGAEVNQNAFSNVTVGNSTIQADGKTDTLTLVAGTGITLTADTTNDKVTIAGSTFVKSGSTAAAGLVPKPPTTEGTTKYLREDGTWQVPPDNNTTYNSATTSAAGLMSAEDKTKLNGIAAGATNVDGSLYVPKVSSGGYVIRGDTNARLLTFLSGTSGNAAYGAKLSLGGADSADAGQFIIQAGNSSGYKQLIGKPDGTFTWGGINIIYTHPTTAGNKHIPAGGSSGQILKYSAAGTAAWSSLSNAGIAPKPVTSSNVGQIVTWGTSYDSDTTDYTLPSGGTWLVWAFSRSKSSGKNDSFSHAGLYAGGSNITHWTNTYTVGMAWRIA